MKRSVIGLGLVLGLAACDEGGSGSACSGEQEFVDGACVEETAIQLNSVGFLPERAKRATSLAPADSFQVLREDGSVAFTGGALVERTEGAFKAYELDFTSVDQPGRYHVEVPGVGRSPAFTIGDDVYDEPFLATMLSFY